MKKNEMSSRQFIEAVLACKPLDTVINGQTIEAKGKALIAVIDAQNAKKRATPSAPTKAYLAGEPFRQAVLAYLTENEGRFTAKAIAEATQLTSAKVATALKQLGEKGMVEKIDLDRNKPLEYKAVVIATAEMAEA